MKPPFTKLLSTRNLDEIVDWVAEILTVNNKNNYNKMLSSSYFSVFKTFGASADFINFCNLFDISIDKINKCFNNIDYKSVSYFFSAKIAI